MTGDNRRTAACVAEEVGVDEFHAEVLPEDKADFIRRERAAGHTVIMIGDGVNDSPALSEADAGIAISTGAAIAREISDITITSEDLFQLVTLPTEVNASRRALAAIESGNLLYEEEIRGARKTLRAAALTYVAALAVSLTQLLRLLVLFGGNGRRRRD